jgi:hypothetical protein
VASACSQPPAKTDLGGLGGQESLSSLRREGNKPSVGFLSPVPNSKRVGQHWHSCTHSWYPSLLRNNKPRKAALAKFVLCSDSFNFLFYLVFFFSSDYKGNIKKILETQKVCNCPNHPRFPRPLYPPTHVQVFDFVFSLGLDKLHHVGL